MWHLIFKNSLFRKSVNFLLIPTNVYIACLLEFHILLCHTQKKRVLQHSTLGHIQFIICSFSSFVGQTFALTFQLCQIFPAEIYSRITSPLSMLRMGYTIYIHFPFLLKLCLLLKNILQKFRVSILENKFYGKIYRCGAYVE